MWFTISMRTNWIDEDNLLHGHRSTSINAWLLATAGAVAMAVSLPVAAGDQADLAVQSRHFLSHHPDLDYRMRGLAALDEGRPHEAMELFEKSAHFADKPSQAMIAEMYFNGDGVPRDRAAAYAWMDLAAERGYRNLLLLRERYWAALDDGERARALSLGVDIYARFGDEVAQPRIAKAIARGRMINPGRIEMMAFPGAGKGEWITMRGREYYASEFWRPDEWIRWQDAAWQAPAAGEVGVGPIRVSPTND